MTKKQIVENIKNILNLGNEDLRIINMMTKNQLNVYLYNLTK
jgi:hypothetical protein